MLVEQGSKSKLQTLQSKLLAQGLKRSLESQLCSKQLLQEAPSTQAIGEDQAAMSIPRTRVRSRLS